MTVLKTFSYLSCCDLTAATAMDNFLRLRPFNRYQTFKLGSRPWYPYFISFPGIIWYLKCQATVFIQFHAFFSPSIIKVCNANSSSDAVALTQFGPTHLEWWHKMPLCYPCTYAVWCMDTDQYLYRCHPRCLRHFWCLFHTLLYAFWRKKCFAHCASCSCPEVSVTSWQPSCHEELHTVGNYHMSWLW